MLETSDIITADRRHLLTEAEAAKVGKIVQFRESGNTLDDAAIELGVYFVFVSICAFLLLDQARGSLVKLKGWMIYRRLEAFRMYDGNPESVTTLIRAASYTYLIMPLVALLGWFVLILFDLIQEKKPLIPAFAILMMGFALWFILLGSFQLTWRNFRLKRLATFSSVIVILLVIGYQYLTVFGYEEKGDRFLPFSVLFLNLNALMIGPIIFIQSFEGKDADIMKLFLEFFPKYEDVQIDPDRDSDITNEIAEQRKDPNYKTSFQDLADMVTMSQVSMEKFKEMLGNGWLGKFKKLPTAAKVAIKISMILLAYLLLVGYSLTLYFLDNKSKLGIIISVSVFCMDLFNVLLSLTGSLKSASNLTMLLFANRICMVGLGQSYWLYGFMILYMIYASVFIFQLTKLLFPFESDVIQHEKGLADLLKQTGDKKSALEKLGEGINPGWLLLLITIEYIVLLVIVEVLEFEGKELRYLPIGKQTLKTYQAAGLTFYIMLTIFLLFSLVRIYFRRATKSDRHNTGMNDGLGKCKAIDRMLFYILFTWVIFIGWAIIFYLMFESKTIAIYCGTLVPAVLFYFRALVFFKLNDWEYFQDVETLNKNIEAHNKQIEQLEKKKEEVRQMLVDGTLVLPVIEDDPEPASPAPPNILQVEEKIEDLTEPESNQIVPEPAAQQEQPPQPKPPGGVQRQPTVNNQEQNRRQAEEQKALVERLRQEELKKAEEEAKKKNTEQEKREHELARRMEEQRQMEELRKAERQQAAAEQKRIQAEQVARKQQEEAEKRKKLEQQQRSKPPVQYEFNGKVQTGEIIDYSNMKVKTKREDAMFEGGEPTETNVSSSQDQKLIADADIEAAIKAEPDLFGEYIDMDYALEQEGGNALVAQKKLRRINDWRLIKEHNVNWLKAYTAGDLRPNDYKFINSSAISVFWWLITEVLLLVLVDGETGAISAFPFSYIAISIYITLSVVSQGRPFMITEYIIWVAVNLIYLGVGVAFFYVKYEVSKFTIDVTKKSVEQELASYFLTLFCFMAPTFTHALVVLLKAIDCGLGEVIKNFKFFMIGTALGLLLILASLFLFVSWVEGVAVLCGIILMAYIISQVYIYLKNGLYLSDGFLLANRILAGLICISSFVVALILPQLSAYEGVSYSGLTLLVMMWSYAIFHLIIDLNSSIEKPIYYSLTLFPIYQYDPKAHDVVDHFKNTAVWMASLILLSVWAFLTAHQMRPHWLGVVVLSIILDLLQITFFIAQEITLNSMIDAKAFMNEEQAKIAWLDAKSQFVKGKTGFSRSDMQTYRRLWLNKTMVEYHLSFITGQKPKEPSLNINKDLREQVWLGNDLEGLADEARHATELLIPQYHSLSVDDPYQVSMVVFDLQKRLKNAYMEELELIIVFLLTVAQNARVYKIREIKRLFRFLEEMKYMLHALGIHILIPTSGDEIQRNRDVQAQIEELEPEKKKLFDQIHDYFKLQEIERLQGGEAARKLREEQMRKRQERAEAEAAEKQRELEKLQDQIGQNAEGDPNIAQEKLDAMPDCKYKYQCILARSKAGKGKYTDIKFTADRKSIGDSVISNNLGNRTVEWKRMSDDQNNVLFKDGVDVNDVVQGALGNCYYLSALGVLGNTKTRDKFYIVSSEDEWKWCGALCIKFYENGKEDYVIIDDMLPQINGQFPFVTSPSRVELWPHFLEKAYAKKGGSYEGIEGGFVDAALTDLTNGVPETWLFEEQNNPSKLWINLMTAFKEGALLGAGSPSHKDGDKARSAKGIVQGHAYSLIKVKEIDGIKLVMLRNPHGEGEWTGDWADDSPQWNARYKNMLEYHESADDGIFWMQWSDFLEEFECIYVSRQFSKLDGWESVLVDDKWEGKYAAGLPHKKNPKAIFHNNPQYTFEVAQHGTAYFILRMKDKETLAKSKLYSYMLVENNRGDVIMRPEKKKTLAELTPVNQVIRSTSIELAPSLSYPLKITTLVANMDSGPEGEGSFNLQFFVKGKAPALEKIN